MADLQKIAFLDRDGVINKKQVEGSYVTSVDLFEFNKDIFGVLKHLADDGFGLVVITNQRGIARGLMSEADLSAIHDYMRAELQKRGIELLDIFFCPHEKNECDCRKPRPGMLEAAAKKYTIDFASSTLISDSASEVEMGKKFGIGKNVQINENEPLEILKQLV